MHERGNYMRQVLSLNGVWKGWPATRGVLATDFYKSSEHTSAWLDIRVPSNWQTQKGFGIDERVVYYHQRFLTPEFAEHQEVLLEFEGVFNHATVWLNGVQIAQHEGYFIPLVANITAQLVKQGENELFVRVEWPAPEKRHQRTSLTGVFDNNMCKPASLHPGGIWQGVNLHIVNEVYIKNVMVATSFTAFNTAIITSTIDCHAYLPTEMDIKWEMAPYNFEGEGVAGDDTHTLEGGENHIELKYSLNKPHLWWPWERGRPNLYLLKIRLLCQERVIDTKEITFGIRSIERIDNHFAINGDKIFLRGANYMPADTHLQKIGREDLERDIHLMLEANLNCVRIYGHVNHPDFYQICDENGLLIWQDTPLQYSYHKSVLPKAKAQVDTMVRQLKSHPSIITWCLHHSPLGDGPATLLGQIRYWLSRAFFNWNRDVLDTQLELGVEQIDDTRPIIKYTGIAGPFLRGGASRFFWGWTTPNFESAERIINLFPAAAEIVCEYGAQAFPGTASMAHMGISPDATQLDWERLKNKYMVKKALLDVHVPATAYDLASPYFMATQQYQARLLKFYTELWRRKKYAPCGCCLQFMFADSAPGVTWSVVDYWRRNKLGYLAMKKAMQPVFVLLKWPRPSYTLGEALSLDIFVINDTLTTFMASAISWKIVVDEQVVEKKRYIADLTADCVYEVAQLFWKIPDDEQYIGEYKIELTLELPTREVITNSYDIKVIG